MLIYACEDAGQKEYLVEVHAEPEDVIAAFEAFSVGAWPGSVHDFVSQLPTSFVKDFNLYEFMKAGFPVDAFFDMRLFMHEAQNSVLIYNSNKHLPTTWLADVEDRVAYYSF